MARIGVSMDDVLMITGAERRANVTTIALLCAFDLFDDDVLDVVCWATAAPDR